MFLHGKFASKTSKVSKFQKLHYTPAIEWHNSTFSITFVIVIEGGGGLVFPIYCPFTVVSGDDDTSFMTKTGGKTKNTRKTRKMKGIISLLECGNPVYILEKFFSVKDLP